MKILIVIPSLHIGGTNRTLFNTLNLLDKSKFKVDILPMSYLGEVREMFKNHNLLSENPMLASLQHDFKSIFNKKNLFALLKTLYYKAIFKFVYKNNKSVIYKKAAKRYDDKYDLVIGFQEGHATHFASFISAHKKIAWVHCDYSNYKRLMGNNDELTIYENYDRVVCVSHYTARVFKNIFPSISDRVIGIHNIMDDSSLFELSKMKTSDNRFQNDKFTLISIGRISEEKRFSLIPRIAAQMSENGCAFRWFIIGTQGNDSQNLLQKIRNHKVEDRVILLGPKDNPYPYVLSSSVLVCPSYSEACPNVVNEAKILHIPVVTADFPTATEFIQSEKNGIIVPIDEMSAKLSLLCNDKQYYEKIKQGILSFEYKNEEIIQAIEKLFFEEKQVHNL